MGSFQKDAKKINVGGLSSEDCDSSLEVNMQKDD